MPDEYLPLIVTALEHYSAYARAVRYEEAADFFKLPSATLKQRESRGKGKRA